MKAYGYIYIGIQHQHRPSTSGSAVAKEKIVSHLLYGSCKIILSIPINFHYMQDLGCMIEVSSDEEEEHPPEVKEAISKEKAQIIENIIEALRDRELSLAQTVFI